MKTSASKQAQAYIKIILDAESLDLPETATTAEMLKAIYKDFVRVANYPNNLHKFPSIVDRFADFLQGLPSGIPIAFMNYEILQLAESWGANVSTERKQDKILADYWRFMANAFFQLCKAERVAT